MRFCTIDSQTIDVLSSTLASLLRPQLLSWSDRRRTTRRIWQSTTPPCWSAKLRGVRQWAWQQFGTHWNCHSWQHSKSNGSTCWTCTLCHPRGTKWQFCHGKVLWIWLTAWWNQFEYCKRLSSKCYWCPLQTFSIQNYIPHMLYYVFQHGPTRQSAQVWRSQMLLAGGVTVSIIIKIFM